MANNNLTKEQGESAKTIFGVIIDVITELTGKSKSKE